MSCSPRPGALALALTAVAAAAAGQPASPPQWGLATEVQGGYQSNVTERTPPEGDVIGRAAARLSYEFGRQRFRGRAAAGLGATAYRQYDSRNQVTWSAGLTATWTVTRTTTLDGGAESSFGYGDAYATVEDPAIPPDVLRRRDVAGASVRHSFSRTLDGIVEVRGDRYDTDASSLDDLGGGWRATARAGVERSRKAEAVLSAFGEYERTSTRGLKLEIERLLVGWREPVQRWLIMSLEGGLARYRPIDLGAVPILPDGGIDPEPTVTPTGLAELTLRFGDHTVSARAGRTVGQVFGFGAVGVSREFSLGYSVNLTSRLGFDVLANDIEFLEGAAGPTYVPLRQRGVRAGLRWGLTRRLDIRVDYSYWWRGEGPEFPGRHTVWAGVRHQLNWR